MYISIFRFLSRFGNNAEAIIKAKSKKRASFSFFSSISEKNKETVVNAELEDFASYFSYRSFHVDLTTMKKP